jgi:hypothetical protein
MLDHDEERRLAEIEAHLLEESPDLQALFDPVQPPPPPPRRLLTAIVRTFVATLMAILVTTATTVLAGPDVGGFVAVVVFCAVGMYGYQTIRGCPGLRRARGQG